MKESAFVFIKVGLSEKKHLSLQLCVLTQWRRRRLEERWLRPNKSALLGWGGWGSHSGYQSWEYKHKLIVVVSDQSIFPCENKNKISFLLPPKKNRAGKLIPRIMMMKKKIFFLKRRPKNRHLIWVEKITNIGGNKVEVRWRWGHRFSLLV